MKNWYLLSLVTVVSIVLAEFVVRELLPRPGFKATLPHHPTGLLIPHPVRGYSYRPAYTGTIRAEEYEIDVRINSLGLRDDEIEECERVDVLAVGDSFTVGFGVQAEEAWPSQLEKYLSDAFADKSACVLNAGISGYGLQQIRLLMEELLYLNPRLVVLGLYPSRYWRINDPYTYFHGSAVRSSRVSRMAPRSGGFLYSSFGASSMQQLQFWAMDHFHLLAHLLIKLADGMRLVGALEYKGKTYFPDARSKLRVVLEELAIIRETLRGRGTSFAVVLINHQESDGSFDAKEREYNAIVTAWGMREGIEIFDPIPWFEGLGLRGAPLRIGKDHHWSARAHAVVGRELGALLLTRDDFCAGACFPSE